MYNIKYFIYYLLINFKMKSFDFLRPHEIAKELGQRLQKHRLKQNKSQAQIAKHIGVSTPTISNLENGRNTSLETFISAVVALGLTKELEDIFKSNVLTISQLEQLYDQPMRQRASSQRKD